MLKLMKQSQDIQNKTSVFLGFLHANVQICMKYEQVLKLCIKYTVNKSYKKHNKGEP